MDVKYVNPFINATLSILEELTTIQFIAGKAYIKGTEIARGDLSGIIGLTGDVKGTIAITFEEKVILKIVSEMFEEEIDEINDEVIDAAGELNNMITGRAIEELAQNEIYLDLSVPSIVHGKNHIVKHLTKAPKIAVPFTTPAGNFTIEVSIEP